MKLSLSLPDEIGAALHAEARENGISLTDLIRELLIGHAAKSPHLAEDYRAWLLLYRELSSDVARIAVELRARDGFSEDITARAVDVAQSDPDWLARYARCIGADPFAGGNPLKTSLNQNIGARVRTALGAEVQKNARGRALTGLVDGLVIKSYSKLKPGT